MNLEIMETKIYRFERNGIGPYRFKFLSKNLNRLSTYVKESIFELTNTLLDHACDEKLSLSRPSILNDKPTSIVDISDYKCACSTKKDLLKWFENELDLLKNSRFQLVEITINKENVINSNSGFQVIFKDKDVINKKILKY